MALEGTLGLGPEQVACIAYGHWGLGLELAGQDRPMSGRDLPNLRALFWSKCEVKVRVRLLCGWSHVKSLKVALEKNVGLVSSG